MTNEKLSTELTLKLSVSELTADPALLIPHLSNIIKERRWFAEKDCEINEIEAEDSFTLIETDSCLITGFSVKFLLTGTDGNKKIKHYYIPLIFSSEHISAEGQSIFTLKLVDAVKYMSFAEHFPVYQKALIENCQKGVCIPTDKGGKVCFQAGGQTLKDLDVNNLDIKSAEMDFSSSNVLTFINNNDSHLISKTYKDLRGSSGNGNKIWLPNEEAPRYEALTLSNYPNIPSLYGDVVYENAEGNKAPISIVMETIEGKTTVGSLVYSGLEQLFDKLGTGSPEHYSDIYKSTKGTLTFVNEIGKTLADMHAALIASKKEGFYAVPVSEGDFSERIQLMREGFSQTLITLKKKSDSQQSAGVLKYLKDAIAGSDGEGNPVISVIEGLSRYKENLIKAQVHGDLHGDQGVIRAFDDSRSVAEVFKAVFDGNNSEQNSRELAARVKWLDFEGPPAKDSVAPDFDSRENILSDLAGMMLAFWYIVNVKLYSYLEFSVDKPETHENQRKASLILAGQLEADVPGLTDELLQVLRAWFSDHCGALIKGYLDQIEAQNLQTAILKDWNRDKAEELISFWVMARALHELRYETYAREWGWEAIPGGRIVQIISSL